VPISGIQYVTENHAKMAYEYIEKEDLQEGQASVLLSEMDGSMIPIVETSLLEGEFDKRKCRKTRWQEARLCMAREPNKVTSFFYSTLGDVDRAGDLLYRVALKAGFGAATQVHFVGDGAPWIVNQVRRVFGSQASYLVDFYHITEYLSEAAEHSWTSEKKEWLHRSQSLLKSNEHKDLLANIRLRMPLDYITEELLEDRKEESPVQKCYRYIVNRQDCLDYKKALEQDLPIGSGEIESAHRSVIQKRMKIPGAWWREDNAGNMLALRSLRANGDWQNYWNYQAA